MNISGADTPLSDLTRTHEVVICCGAGGVGKTTVSAALGLAAVRDDDRRILVLTVDPARRLATALGMERLALDPVPIARERLRRAGLPVQGDMFAAMLDVKSAWDRMVFRYAPDRATAERIIANPLYQGITESFSGSQEYAAMEALYELHQGGEYDCVIIDTPPSQNAVDFLDSPRRFSDFVGARLLTWLAGGPTRLGLRAAGFAAKPVMALADRLLGGEVLTELGEFIADLQQLYGGVQDRAAEVNKLLRSSAVSFVVVTALEAAPVTEAKSLIATLDEYRMPLGALVANQVLAPGLAGRPAAAVAAEMADKAEMLAAISATSDFSIAAEEWEMAAGDYLFLHRLALRQHSQLQSLVGGLSLPAVQIPMVSGQLRDLGALAQISGFL